MRENVAQWPFARSPDGNLHSDGSHGLFNARMRETQGHVLFVGPEAINHLSPEFPERGRCDKSSFVDMPRLLDLATGGRYNWGTAIELKEGRAAARAQLRRSAIRLPTGDAATTNHGEIAAQSAG